MAKKGLESQVREILIQQKTDELVKYATEDPNYKTMVTEIAEAFGNYIIESIASSLGENNEEERTKIFEEYKAEVLPKIRTQLDNPQQLRSSMEEQARNYYLSYNQFKSKIRSQVKELKEDREIDIDENSLGEYENSFEWILQYVKNNDKIVRRLAKIAGEKGLETATKKETIYGVIREFFPTSDDFRTYVLRGVDDVINFFRDTQKALMSDGEAGQIIGGVFGAMGKAVEKTIETQKRINLNYIENSIKEIYS